MHLQASLRYFQKTESYIATARIPDLSDDDISSCEPSSTSGAEHNAFSASSSVRSSVSSIFSHFSPSTPAECSSAYPYSAVTMSPSVDMDSPTVEHMTSPASLRRKIFSCPPPPPRDGPALSPSPASMAASPISPLTQVIKTSAPLRSLSRKVSLKDSGMSLLHETLVNSPPRTTRHLSSSILLAAPSLDDFPHAPTSSGQASTVVTGAANSNVVPPRASSHLPISHNLLPSQVHAHQAAQRKYNLNLAQLALQVSYHVSALISTIDGLCDVGHVEGAGKVDEYQEGRFASDEARRTDVTTLLDKERGRDRSRRDRGRDRGWSRSTAASTVGSVAGSLKDKKDRERAWGRVPVIA